jgi:hypothetical protein
MTFDQLMDDAKATIDERRECAYFLASYRMRRTLEWLLPIRTKLVSAANRKATEGLKS